MCSLCYQEGRFPASTTAAEYAKLENERYRSIGDKDAPWTDSELLLLLEGLEMFDDNWESVADHVGSRTREECVMKFLQLEIEDRYLDEAPSANVTSGGLPQDLSFLAGSKMPITQFENPVLSVMGFLAGLADPATAAKAAGKSVEEVRKTLRSQIEREATPGAEKESNAGKEGSSGPTDAVKPESRGESMDVDDTTSLATREPPPNNSSHDLPTTALSLTAARAAALASHTERQLTAQVSAAVNLELTKLELKLQQFSEMEALLQAERREVERMRQRLFLDRLAFRKRIREVETQMGGMRIEVGRGEKMGLTQQGPDGQVPQAEATPWAEGMEAFMRHEI